MEIWNILGYIILAIICFIFAPLMTIGVILINADALGFTGDVLGIIFIIAGLARMMNKVFGDNSSY